MKKRKQLKKILFIEGTSEEDVASLSQGFTKLFRKVLAGNMPRIVMGDGKSTTIKKIKNNIRSQFSFLLIDLDDSEDKIDEVIQELKLEDKKDCVFFMVQEVEAWFLSQPNMIEGFFGRDVMKKIPKQEPMRATSRPILPVEML